MAYTTIDDPSAYFNTLLWTGNGADNRALTNNANAGNFQPDFVWVKGRSQAEWHNVYDSSRGANKGLYPNSTYQEESLSQTFESFDTNGFTVSYNSAYNSVFTNKNSTTYVAWQWKVNGGTTTSLSSNINSVCQVNQDAGISIVKYTCTGGGNGQAVQHGLGLVPQVIITKNRTDNSYSDWITYHHYLTKDNFVKLNSTAALATNSPYNGANVTSTTYNVSIDLVEQKDYVTYCFAPIQGYSKFDSYEGNSNANGPFIYTGFKPAFVMLKPVDIAEQWVMHDGTRDPFNKAYHYLFANGAEAEASGGTHHIDLLSNGFKIRTSNNNWNPSSTVIYMAFAENPFVTSTGIPTTAR